MAAFNDLRPALQERLRPLARRLAARGAGPSQVTFAALALSALGGLFILVAPRAAWPLVLLPVILLLRAGLDALEDLLSREHGLQTPFGATLTELADVISDALLYLPLAAVPGVPGPLVTVAVVLGVVAEMAGVVAAQLGGRRRRDGPMGRADRAIAFGGIALLLGFGAQTGPWLDIAFLIVIGLIGLTMINRVRGGMRDAGR